MHDFVLIIEILGESTSWNILDLPLKHFRDWIAHLLEDVQEEHKFVLPLLAICHVLCHLINGILQIFILLEHSLSLLRLLLKLAAVPIKDQVKFEIFPIPGWSLFHLILEYQSSSLLVLQYLSLQQFDFIVTLVNLTSHLLDVAPSLGLVTLEVLHLILILLHRHIFVLYLAMSIL